MKFSEMKKNRDIRLLIRKFMSHFVGKQSDYPVLLDAVIFAVSNDLDAKLLQKQNLKKLLNLSYLQIYIGLSMVTGLS